MSFNWKKCEDELPELRDWISNNGITYKISKTCIVIVDGEPDIASYGSIFIDENENENDGSVIGWKLRSFSNGKWNKVNYWCYFEWPEEERK